MMVMYEYYAHDYDDDDDDDDDDDYDGDDEWYKDDFLIFIMMTMMVMSA